MRILVPKPGILVPKLQRLEGPSRSREEDEHVAGQRLLYRVAPPWDTEDGRVVAVAAELGCVESRARDEQLELGPEARDVRE